eukprot:2857770-Alexandrium_andersonii.AAC.1
MEAVEAPADDALVRLLQGWNRRKSEDRLPHHASARAGCGRMRKRVGVGTGDRANVSESTRLRPLECVQAALLRVLQRGAR